MDFARFLSLLFTENCMVTRANATSDELSVLYMTSPQHSTRAWPSHAGSAPSDVFAAGPATRSTALMLIFM